MYLKKCVCFILLLMLISFTVFTSCGQRETEAPPAVTGSNASSDKAVSGGNSAPASTPQSSSEDSNFNKTGLPIVNERVTLKAIATVADDEKPIAECEMYKELEEKTNIQIEYTEINSKVWPEKKGILFTSGDLPDFIIGDNTMSTSDLMKYGSQGLIIDLKDLMDEYNPYLKAKMDSIPGFENSITTDDGKIYGYPGIDNSPMQVSNLVFINKDWLKAVNKEVPQTTDEFYEVLKLFKTEDPNGNGKPDEIPMTFLDNNCSDYFGAFGVLDYYNANDKTKNHVGVTENGTKVYYTAITDGYKEAIKYFNKLFSEGLIDPEAFSQDSQILNGKVKAEERIVGVLQGWRKTAWQRTPEDDDYVVLPPLEGPNGDRMFPSRYSTNNGPFSFGSCVITNKCENPEIVARWVDEWYEPDFSYQISLNLKFGIHVEKQADGTITPLQLRDDFDPNANIFFWNGNRIHNLTVADYNRSVPLPAHIQQKIELEQPYLPYLKEKDMMPTILLNIEDSNRIIQLATDINGYADECYARWITSGGIDEEWDSYVKKIKSMGVDEYISIYQKALDRFNQN